jgi:Zn-dependent metalloprotease
MLLGGLDELDFVRSKEVDIVAHELAHPGTVNTKAPQATK